MRIIIKLFKRKLLQPHFLSLQFHATTMADTLCIIVT